MLVCLDVCVTEHWTGLCPLRSADTTNVCLYFVWVVPVETVVAIVLCVSEILDLNIFSAQIQYWWSNSTVNPEFVESQQAYSKCGTIHSDLEIVKIRNAVCRNRRHEFEEI